MSLTPTVYTPNPFLPYCWIKIGGVEVTTKYGRPHSFMGMVYERQTANAMNSFTFTLFDPNWSETETLLIQQGEEIQFQYGYTEGIKSPIFTGMVMEYTPVFTIDGVKLTISGISWIAKTDDSTVSRRDWGEKDIHEIVQTIADEHGWMADIDECLEILENDDLEVAQPVKAKWVQQRMTDMAFIAHILQPKAVRKKDKVANYKLAFDDAKRVLHFHPPRDDKGPRFVYKFMRDPMSEVISFAPQVDGKVMLRKGAGVSAQPFIDRQTGYYDKVVHNDASTGEKILLGGPYTYTATTDNEDYQVTEFRPVRDQQQADLAARDRFYIAANHIFQGVLVIMGDPRLAQFDIIRIIVLLPDGSLHYTTGLYRVDRIVDEIGEGQFTTTLEVSRNGMPGTKDVKMDKGTGTVNR